MPDSLYPHSLPNEVTAQVPETKGFLFIRMPDRVLLIDPEEKTVVEIVADASLTGADSGAEVTFHPAAGALASQIVTRLG